MIARPPPSYDWTLHPGVTDYGAVRTPYGHTYPVLVVGFFRILPPFIPRPPWVPYDVYAVIRGLKCSLQHCLIPHPRSEMCMPSKSDVPAQKYSHTSLIPKPPDEMCLDSMSFPRCALIRDVCYFVCLVFWFLCLQFSLFFSKNRYSSAHTGSLPVHILNYLETE